MTQAELDKLLRDSENELEEMGGALVVAEKDHEKHINEMNASTLGMQDDLWNETDTKKAAYEDAKGNYSGEAELVKELEDELKAQAENVTNLKIKFGDLNEEMEYQMMVLDNCNCPEENLGLIASAAEAALNGRPVSEGPALLAKQKALLREQDPGRQMMLKTCIEIERVEAKLVEATKAAQDEQSAYDATVNGLMAQQEKMKMNHTTFSGKQVRDADSIVTRSDAQQKAKDALTNMVATKTGQAESIALRLHAAETQVEALKTKLSACGCK
jgi:hypothetical protein